MYQRWATPVDEMVDDPQDVPAGHVFAVWMQVSGSRVHIPVVGDSPVDRYDYTDISVALNHSTGDVTVAPVDHLGRANHREQLRLRCGVCRFNEKRRVPDTGGMPTYGRMSAYFEELHAAHRNDVAVRELVTHLWPQ